MGEAKPKPSGRRLELDAVRGLMLVWITLTHLPTAASTYVNQPFGIVSAAEGFIFLSALFTGRIYFRMAEHDGYRATIFKLWNRTLRLYGYHALLLAFVFLVAVPIASRGNRPGLHNLLDFYFMAGAKQSFIEAALLFPRPAPSRHPAHVNYFPGIHSGCHIAGTPLRLEAYSVVHSAYVAVLPIRF